MPLRVIGAGFGRTGTLSLKAALEQLGFDPCYHMAEIIGERPGVNDGHVDAWHAFVCAGRPMDWQKLFAGYQACVDFPTCIYYRELLAAFPEAPVVLTVRDPGAWYESWCALQTAAREIRRVTQHDPRMRRWGEFVEVLEERWLGGEPERTRAIAAFERHVAEVKAGVPAERLLVFDVREGWAPLCAFLGRPVPEGPFPHLNEREFLAQMPAALARGDASLADRLGLALPVPGSKRGETPGA